MKPTVVVGYDSTPSSERALAEAGREAAWRGASVTVVHAFHWIPVTTPMAYVPMDVEVSLKEGAESVADTGTKTLLAAHPGMTVTAKVAAGPAADALAETARGADLLVLGNRGLGGFTGLLLGSVSMRTLSYASCPTMIVRGRETGGEADRGPAGEVILALDFEDPADEVIDFAFAEAARRGARLHVISVWDLAWTITVEPETPDDLDRTRTDAAADLADGLEELLGPWHTGHPEVPLDLEVADGSPSAVLVAATHDADLVITGAHRRTDGHPGMRLGPVTHALLHHADCPVAVVPRG